MPDTPDKQPRASANEESVKETLIAIIISFALAFVARSYVAEPFIIPTGSMAPTLLGSHMRFHSPDTGYTWPSNPRDYADTARDKPINPQGDAQSGRDPITYQDPMSHRQWSQADVPLQTGDRILVQKYLYALRDPKRWDVVVFKHPEEPKTNLIKRLVGLPNEQLALVDGDVFTRASLQDPWAIQRKPRRVQNAVWATIFASQYTPTTNRDEVPFRSPWQSPGWNTTSPIYRWNDSSPGTLTWNNTNFPIVDTVPYNNTAGFQSNSPFPVSDLLVSFAINPDAPLADIAIRLTARQHDFEVLITPTQNTTLRMRPVAQRRDPNAWVTLDTAPTPNITPGIFTPIEFAHVDQSLSIRIQNTLVAHADYDWSAPERLGHSLVSTDPNNTRVTNPRDYLRPSLTITVAGNPVSLARVTLQRDLYYQSQRSGIALSRASSLETAVVLDNNQFFMLGDNSPASRDARAFDHIDPWVANFVGGRVGVIHRDLIMGRAFLVYFPSPHRTKLIPIPDFGRIRLIN